MSLIDETTRQRWLELLKGGPYQPRVSPLEGVTTLLAHLLGSPLPTHDATAAVAADLVRTDVEAKSDEPIPALLPRDWPAHVDRLLDDLGASELTRQAAYALVDSWVLAAVDTDQDHDSGVDVD